ncbi:MAG TPA: CvpA family protein [Burkholderiales bacterium]|nr:CvpA family protein [Burkholderiales bacterium]
MTAFDHVVLAIIGLSILLSVIRGLVREVLSLLAWAAGFMAAGAFASDLAVLLPAEVSDERLRLAVGFGAIFLVVLLSMSLLALMVSRLVTVAGLAVEDRVLGGAFGLFRGLLVVVALVLVAGLTSLPRQPAWREAWLSGLLEGCAGYVKSWLPARLAQRITYD